METQERDQFENIIEGYLNGGYGVCDDFLSADLVRSLRDNLESYHHSGMMHPAGVGKNFDYKRNAEIRGDVIRWIDSTPADSAESDYISKINRFVAYLNATCYTGINDHEFHYAYYETGSFYKRHLDRFKNDKGRQFSLVLYLNEDWHESDGGRLSLYLDDEDVSLYPVGGRVVFFKSDVTEHEVHPSEKRPRLSIAGWLKRI